MESSSEKPALLKIVKIGKPLNVSFRCWDMYEYPLLPKTTHHTWSVKTSTQLEKPRFLILALRNKKDKDNIVVLTIVILPM